MQCNICRILFVLPVFLIVGCSTDYAARDGERLVVQEKTEGIENEPITRLSFLPAQDVSDEIEVVIFQDNHALAQIMPASEGDVSAAETLN